MIAVGLRVGRLRGDVVVAAGDDVQRGVRALFGRAAVAHLHPVRRRFIRGRRDERVAVAQRCCSSLEISMPVLVDDMDDRVGHTYSGMPDRLYVIDRDGRIAYKGGRGPFGFKSREMEQALIMLLLDQARPDNQSAHGIPILSDAETWKVLPALDDESGSDAMPASVSARRSMPSRERRRPDPHSRGGF